MKGKCPRQCGTQFQKRQQGIVLDQWPTVGSAVLPGETPPAAGDSCL